ncbi:hypothetical protein FA014_01080 [Cellulomonas hominis]|uniref:Uncharacterized protein n=1 Tax=Cellulomonas hominis TaxID=156981 RepID=A0A7Z8K375_9CELL|nr:hypothetical protein [Cellulomonas hominis]TKR27322.1 hypothetical protein FA014_01080 [Cellulomonas hominis]
MPHPPSPARARILWWAPTIAIAIITLVGGTASLLTGEPLGVAVGCFAITVVAGSGGLRAREQYRRGWRHGYESAVRTMLEHSAGRTPDVEARAAVHGDPTPEPWDEHHPVPIFRSAP